MKYCKYTPNEVNKDKHSKLLNRVYVVEMSKEGGEY